MHIFKRVLVLMLLSAMLLSAFACSSGDGAGDTTSAAAPTGTVTEAETTTADTRVYPKLPEKDYKGADFVLVGYQFRGASYLYTEEQTGEPVNDAIFERNRRVESEYGVNLKYSEAANPTAPVSAVQTSVLAADGAYDLVSVSLAGAINLAVGGASAELGSVEHIDLEAPWWDAKSIECLTVGGKLYMAVSSINVLCDNMTTMLFFNKELAENLKLDNPYTLVRNDKWVWDTFYNMAKAASKDVNGDGKQDDLDQIGIIGANEHMAELPLNLGEPVMRMKNGAPYLALDTTRSSQVIEAVFKVMSDGGAFLSVNDYSSKYKEPWSELMYPMFKEGRGLFNLGSVQYVFHFRDSDVNYGILPRPKYNEAQEEYIHYPSWYWSDMTVIPSVPKDAERNGIITEALAADTLYGVHVVNLETSIINKQLRDADSAEMLELIFSTRFYDWGQFYTTLTGLRSSLTKMIASRTNTFASLYAAEKTSAETKIADFVKSYTGK